MDPFVVKRLIERTKIRPLEVPREVLRGTPLSTHVQRSASQQVIASREEPLTVSRLFERGGK